MNRIYLDHAATTPIDTEVLELMNEIYRYHYGNPSSIHAEGRKARTLIENARKTIAHALNASMSEIFFTSGGTEANNTAIKNAVRDLGVRHIISSPTEHPSVLKSLDAVRRDFGVEVTLLNVDAQGHIDLNQLEEHLRSCDKKCLISLMYVNNEIGTVHPIDEISALAQKYDALFHTDSVQAMGSFEINVQQTKISFLSSSAHKFNGPKAVGFMYINSDNIIRPLIDGGGQERNMRAGTENAAQIAGMALALKKALDEHSQRIHHIRHLRSLLLDLLRDQLPEAGITGDTGAACHPKIINLSLPASAKSEMVVFNLDIRGISVSGGSACSSGVESASPVLEAIGMPEDRRALRLSLSHLNTEDEIRHFVEALKEVL